MNIILLRSFVLPLFPSNINIFIKLFTIGVIYSHCEYREAAIDYDRLPIMY